MVRQVKPRQLLCRVGVFLIGTAASIGSLIVVACNVHPADNIPLIRITLIPPAVEGGPIVTYSIVGVVERVDFAAYKVVVYAHAGDSWWVQPYADAPMTHIGKDGKWRTVTHGGHQYAALLVKKEYHPDAITRTLPATDDDVVAIDLEDGKSQ
jgi:hypothetical protein